MIILACLMMLVAAFLAALTIRRGRTGKLTRGGLFGSVLLIAGLVLLAIADLLNHHSKEADLLVVVGGLTLAAGSVLNAVDVRSQRSRQG